MIHTLESFCSLSVSHFVGWTHIQCFGHRLHLAVQNSIKDCNLTKEAIKVMKNVVNSINHSRKKKRSLLAAQVN